MANADPSGDGAPGPSVALALERASALLDVGWTGWTRLQCDVYRVSALSALRQPLHTGRRHAVTLASRRWKTWSTLEEPALRLKPRCSSDMRLGLRLTRAALPCAIVIAGVSSARAAPPDSPSIDEALESPDGDPCLTRASLVGGIARWLERDDVGGMLRVRVHGSSKSEVRFEILREGGTVARVFDARTMSCEALRGVVTFSIAIAIESALREARAEAQANELTAGTRPEISPGVAVPERSGTRTLTKEAPKPKKTGSLHVSLEEVVLVGNPPGVSLGAELGFARRFESGWELAAGALQTTGSTTLTLDDETVRTWLSVGWARACRELPSPLRTLRLALCAGGGAGSLSMRGYGPSGRSTSRFWGALYLRGEAELPITSHLSLRFGLAPEVVVARPSLVIVETGTGRPRRRLTTQPAAFALSVGLVMSF